MPPRLLLLLAFLLSALTAPLLIPRFADRWIALDLHLRASGPVAFRWSNPSTSNGLWLDFNDPLFISRETAPDTRTIHLTHRLPSYAIDDLRIEALSGSVTIANPKVYTYLLNIRLPTQSLSFTTANPVTLTPSLPPTWRVVGWRGFLLCGSAGLALTLLWLTIRRAFRALDARFKPALPAPGSRRLTRATIAICIAAPILMALWPPMFLTADTTAYLRFAHILLNIGTIDHFDGWRLPGYGLMLAPFIAALRDYAPAVGALQALMGIATSLLVFAMLRPRLPRPWPHAAAVMVAIDPVLLGWQRFVMAETASAFCITLGAWLFLRLAPCTPHTRAHTLPRTLATAAALAATCTAAILLRGNNLIVPTVLLAALLWCALLHKRRDLLAAAATTAALIGLALLPLFILNHQHYGRFTLTVGSNFTRSLFSWENETTDWNQCGTLSLDEFRAFRDYERNNPLTDWDVMGWIAKTHTVPVPPGAPEWLAMDIRAGALVDESLARLGTVFTRRQYQASLALLGIPVAEPFYALGGTWGLFAQLMGRDYHRTSTNFDFTLDKFPPDMQSLIMRSTHDVSWLRTSKLAHAYAYWFDLWKWWRTILGIAFLIALARLLALGRWAFAAIGLVVLGNIIGVPILTYAAEYRYAAPFYPLLAVTIALGLSRTTSKRAS